MAVLAVEGIAVNTEQQLLEKARSGDTESFSALVELFQERAVRAAWSVTGNLEDARDLAQDAFVKAYENLGRFDGRSGFYTWFYRILLNTCKDFLRRQKVRKTFSFWFGRDEEGEEAEFDPPSPAPNSRDDADSRALGDATSEALARLPERQREVFMLRYLEGLDLKAIADATGTSLGAVKANLWHASQKMREALKAFRTEGEEAPR
jgi:RNA polymerase sigma-70 factor (ECF subfamily)